MAQNQPNPGWRRHPPQPSHHGGSGSRLQHRLIQAQICNQLFQSAVLFLELFHLSRLVRLHTNILLLPSIEGLFADPHSLGKLLLCVYLTSLGFIFVALGLICHSQGISLLKFLKYIREEILIALGTSSSETVLPRMIVKMERLGCSKSVVGLVIPAGYSFKLDGTSIYLTIAALFIAQATNTHLSIREEALCSSSSCSTPRARRQSPVADLSLSRRPSPFWARFRSQASRSWWGWVFIIEFENLQRLRMDVDAELLHALIDKDLRS